MAESHHHSPEDNTTTTLPKYEEFVHANLSTSAPAPIPTPNAAKIPTTRCCSLLRSDPNDDKTTKGLQHGLRAVVSYAFVSAGATLVALVVFVVTPTPQAGEDTSGVAAFLKYIMWNYIWLLAISSVVNMVIVWLSGFLIIRALDKKRESRSQGDIELGQHGDRPSA